MQDAVPAPVAEMPATEMATTVMPSCNCCNTPCCTKKKKEAATAAMKGAYKGVFYANDFSYLNDPCYDGPSFLGDSLKGLMGGKLDIGGEARMRYHSENNHRGLGLTGNDDNFFLTRYRMFANMRVNDYFRVYGEYLYADSGGETFNNRPIEENRGEIQNLFLDTRLTESLSFRVGRQELLLGAQRLVSPLDWANTRRTFEGYRGTYQGDEWTVDGWFVNPVNRNAATESRIDDANFDVDFWGVYGSKAGTRFGTVDTYYMGLSNEVLNFDYHNLGSRVVGSTDNGWLYEYEGAYQFGTNSDGSSHDASFLTGGIGRKLSICTGCGEWNPIVWAWYDWASGEEDPTAVARGDNGFDHFFPLAHKYNGFMDLFGRRNLHDINFQFITPILGPKVKLLLWYHHFFLDQATTPYSVVMTPFNAANVAGDRELGQEIDVLFNIAINPRNSALIGYSHFNAGDYYDTTAGVPTNADADFFYFQIQTRF
ncbi:MAG: alginate export family protein [Planctomycetota bacterium]